MCGRAYETYTDEELVIRYQNERLKRNPLGLIPNYNMSPTHLSPVLFIRNGEKAIERFRWGLIPFWAKDVKSAEKYSLINAKAEEIHEKRSYKTPFEKRRCIVPLSGFFEWKAEEDKSKRPFAIHFKDEQIMSAAGVWELFVSQETGEEIHSFSIITTEPNSFMKGIHRRMPAFIPKEREDEYLDPQNKNIEAIRNLIIQPCPSDWMAAFEVSTLVNSPKNNTPEVLKPISSHLP